MQVVDDVDEGPIETTGAEDQRSEFAKRSDEFKALCRPRWFYHSDTFKLEPYHSDRPHLGKKVVRANKRVKVAAMRASR